MTIPFFARRYLPHRGGVEKHIAGLCIALFEELPGARIVVVTEKHQEDLKDHEVIDGVEVYRIPLPAQKTNKLAIWRWLLAHFRLLLAADVIHIHDVFFWLLPFRPLLFWKKFFITFHGYEPPGPPNWKQKLWHQVAELSTEKNICIGGSHQKWYGVKPDAISFGAVDPGISEVARKKITPRNVLFVGRLAEDTGIKTYLEAVKIVAEKSHPITLDIYGTGPLDLELKSYAQQHKLPVIFHGVAEITQKLYQKYDCVLVSGYLTILEALSAGVPVIATYQTDLKQDYLTQTPFGNWITITSSAIEVGAALVTPQEVAPQAIEWANAQTWSKLAKSYLKIWKTE